MADVPKNLAYSTVATAPSPAASGTSLVVATGEGTRFPTAGTALVWPTSAIAHFGNAELVRFTRSTDTFTIVRAHDGTSARTIVIGDQIALVIAARDIGFPFFAAAGFGAIGDGTTNDTAALQAAINAAAVSGGTVVLNSGTYMSDMLTIYSNVHLMGVYPEATIIKLHNAQNTPLIRSENFLTLTGTNALGIHHWGLHNLTLDGNKANQTGAASLLQTFGYDFMLSNSHIRNSKGIGWESEWGDPGGTNATGGMEAHVIDVKCYLNDSHGLQNDGPHDSMFTRMLCYDNGGRGCYHKAKGTGAQYFECHNWGTSQTYAWYVEGAPANFNGCVGEGASTANFYIGANTCMMDGCWIYAPVTNSIGLELGASLGDLKCTGLHITDFAIGTGAAIKFGAGEGGNQIHGYIYQNGNAVFSGTPADTDDIDLLIAGTGTMPTYHKQFQGASRFYSSLRADGAFIARTSAEVGAAETTQFPIQMAILATGHATSERAAFSLGPWQMGNDPDGDGSRKFYIYDGVAAAGRLSIDSSGHIFPGSNNTVDLGWASGAFRAVYLNQLRYPSGSAGQIAQSDASGIVTLASRAFSRGGTALNPASGSNIVVWRAPFACTVTAVKAKCKGGTSFTFNARRNGASNHLASAGTASAGDATTDLTDGGAVQNNAYAAGDRLEIMFVTVTGSVTEGAIQVDFTRP